MPNDLIDGEFSEWLIAHLPFGMVLEMRQIYETERQQQVVPPPPPPPQQGITFRIIPAANIPKAKIKAPITYEDIAKFNQVIHDKGLDPLLDKDKPS